jgi:hypothetical protein
MSGSRGEANFVWRCKNCKVRAILQPHLLDSRTVQLRQFSDRERHRHPSRLLRFRTNKASLRSRRRSSSLTAEVLSLQSLFRRLVFSALPRWPTANANP